MGIAQAVCSALRQGVTILVAVMLFLCAAVPTSAIAGGLTPGGGAVEQSNDPRAKAGHLHSAVLESVGLYLLSDLLDVLTANDNRVAKTLGAILFVLSTLSGAMIIAFGGSYKFGLWFILGPPLSFWMIESRVPVSPTQWQFGDRKFDSAEAEQAYQDAIEGLQKPAGGTAGGGSGSGDLNIPRVVSVFNRLSSSLIETVVSLLNFHTNDNDLDMVQKMSRYVMLNQLEPPDPRFAEVFSKDYAFKCSRFLFLDKADAPAGARADVDSLREQASAEVQAEANNRNNSLDEIFKTKEDKEFFKVGLDAIGNRKVLSCQELWKVLVITLRKEALAQIALTLGGMLPIDSSISRQAKELARKFDVEAHETQEKTEKSQADPVAGYENLVNYVVASMAVRAIQQANPFIIRETSTLPRSVNYLEMESSQATVHDQFRKIADIGKFFGKGAYIEAAMSLPYIQGLILLFLAWMFPFFALALIVPGRHHAFLLWFAMWFWAKSWDIGYAVVALVDQMLFAVMPMGDVLTQDELINSPRRALQVVLATDPSVNLHMQYNILSTLLFGIPVLMGLLVKKGGGDVIQAVSQGLRSASEDFGGSFRNYWGGQRAFDRYKLANQNTLRAEQQAYEQTRRSSEYIHEVALERQYNTQRQLVPEVMNIVNKQGIPRAREYFKGSDSALKVINGFEDFLKKYRGGPALAGVAGAAGNSLFKEASGDFKTLVDSSLEMASKYHGARASALLNYNIAKAAHEESTSVRSFALYEEAVMFGHNSHDWPVQAPGGEALELVKAVASPNFSSYAAKLNALDYSRGARVTAGVLGALSKQK